MHNVYLQETIQSNYFLNPEHKIDVIHIHYNLSSGHIIGSGQPNW